MALSSSEAKHLLQQQNLLLEGLDLAVAKPMNDVESTYGGMEKGLRKQPGDIVMAKPKQKF